MKRAFSFRNSEPDAPIEPLSAASEAPEPGPSVEKTERDLVVVPEGGRFGELLVRKQLVSRGSIMEALLQQTGTGKRLGALLVDAGAITERQLAETLAEQLKMPMADLRKSCPRPTPSPRSPSTSPGNWWPSRCASRATPSTSPSPTRLPRRCGCFEGDDAARDRPAHRPALRRGPGDRGDLPVPRRHPQPRAGLLGHRHPPQGSGRHRRDPERPRRRRCRSAGREGRQPAHRPGAARPGVRHPHGAAGHADAGPVPRRRRPPRHHQPAGGDGSGRDQPHQDHGRDEHRRAPPSPGRPDVARDRRPRPRRPDRLHPDDLRREGHHATPRQEPPALHRRRPRHADRHPRCVEQARPFAVRDGRAASARPVPARRRRSTPPSATSTRRTATS